MPSICQGKSKDYSKEHCDDCNNTESCELIGKFFYQIRPVLLLHTYYIMCIGNASRQGGRKQIFYGGARLIRKKSFLPEFGKF